MTDRQIVTLYDKYDVARKAEACRTTGIGRALMRDVRPEYRHSCQMCPIYRCAIIGRNTGVIGASSPLRQE